MGRTLIFKTPEELESKINEYFRLCDEGKEVEELTKRGELVKYKKTIPYTIEGMADHLDCDPKTLRNYGQKDAFLPVVRRAKNKVHRQWIEKGLTDNFNSKVVCLCIAANIPDYRLNNENKINLQISLEDRLKKLVEQRKQQERIAAPSDPDVIDMD